MPQDLIYLPAKIKPSSLVEFDLFTKMDADAVNVEIPLTDLEASENLLNFMLRIPGWKGYKFNNGKQIGYGTSANTDGIGLTERESYNDWITVVKQKERKLKNILPVNSLPQSVYDALLSLYYHTGSISKVGTEQRLFEILEYVKNKQWQWLATALISSNNQRIIRQGEARIMMLADYGTYKSRDLLRAEGIQDIRSKYPALLDDDQKMQAEYIYYAETQRFLPNMDPLRQKQVVRQYKQSL